MMGKAANITPYSALATAGRRRLAERLRQALPRLRELANTDPWDDRTQAAFEARGLELGRLIRTESLLRYSQAETPAQLQPAPWFYVLQKLLEEHPDINLKPSWLKEMTERAGDCEAIA